jgi:hypothetical protein
MVAAQRRVFHQMSLFITLLHIFQDVCQKIEQHFITEIACYFSLNNICCSVYCGNVAGADKQAARHSGVNAFNFIMLCVHEVSLLKYCLVSYIWQFDIRCFFIIAKLILFKKSSSFYSVRNSQVVCSQMELKMKTLVRICRIWGFHSSGLKTIIWDIAM